MNLDPQKPGPFNKSLTVDCAGRSKNKVPAMIDLMQHFASLGGGSHGRRTLFDAKRNAAAGWPGPLL